MSGSTFGTLFRVTTWGESHGPGVGVVIDGVGNGAVAVDLLKGNLPLVVTLHAGEGDHGIERAGQALLPRVMLRTI